MECVEKRRAETRLVDEGNLVSVDKFFWPRSAKARPIVLLHDWHFVVTLVKRPIKRGLTSASLNLPKSRRADLA